MSEYIFLFEILGTDVAHCLNFIAFDEKDIILIVKLIKLKRTTNEK